MLNEINMRYRHNFNLKRHGQHIMCYSDKIKINYDSDWNVTVFFYKTTLQSIICTSKFKK